MLHIVVYGSLVLAEAVSVGASMSSLTGGAALLALTCGLLCSVPTANHCAERLFALVTRGSDWAQTD
jgi:hypothetical protein